MIASSTAIIVAVDDRYGYLDLTDELRRAVKDAGLTDGMVVAFCAHTTCALLIERVEEGALADFRRHLTDFVPHEVHLLSARRFRDPHPEHARGRAQERARPRQSDAAVRHLPRDPRHRRRTGVRHVAEIDPVRDGQPKDRTITFHVFEV